MFTNLEIYERAWRKSGGDKLPKRQPLEQLENLILITEENRKQYVKLGNSLWSIKRNFRKPNYDVTGVFPIIPCLKKGHWYFKNDPYHKGIMSIYSPEDYSDEDWARGYREVIGWGIKQKSLYFNPSCPKVKWKFSESRLTK